MVTAAGLIPEPGDLTKAPLRTDERLDRALDMRDEYTLLLSELPEPNP